MSSHKILVAVDPFTKESTDEAIVTLNSFANAFDYSVQAASVISPDRVLWPEDFDESWRDSFQQIGEGALKETLEKGGAPQSWNRVIVTESKSSAKAAAHALVSAARDSRSDMLGVIAFQRPNHWLGGFANRLINESPFPVLIVKAKSPAVTKFKRLLFATDFDDADRAGFAKAVEMARQAGAKLVLVSVLIAPPAEVIESSGLIGGLSNLDRFLKKQEIAARNSAEEWMKAFPNADVEWVLFYATTGVSDAILTICQNQSCDAIFMRSSSAPVAAFLLGSVARDVVHRASVPVFVMK